jgi:hypothetical protein
MGVNEPRREAALKRISNISLGLDTHNGERSGEKVAEAADARLFISA